MRDLLEDPGAEKRNTIYDVVRIMAEVAIRLGTHEELEENEVYRWADFLLDGEEIARLETASRQPCTPFQLTLLKLRHVNHYANHF